ncbi:EF hand domain-containing protein, putative [Eimeria brunetti]|uniref:EF hand domain-containing protein, putative n=1 Tax=Eimeria brunetti TaxID=51314 RepID=U6LKJ7_9EIME|nr:EF hand domain-containing protein, putative [Eimeria brunetti]
MQLSLTARQRLAHFFVSVAELEGQVEELRTALAHSPVFAAHKAFAALDPLGNGFLTSGDLQRYLRNHGIAVTDSEAYNLLRRLDTNADGKVSFPEDNDGRLKYLEFVEAVLPSNYPSSRSFTDSLAAVRRFTRFERLAVLRLVGHPSGLMFELQRLQETPLCVCPLETSSIGLCSHSAALRGSSSRLARSPKCSTLRSSSSNSSLLRRQVLQPRRGCSCSGTLRSCWTRSCSSSGSDDSLLPCGAGSAKATSRFVASECEVAGVLNSQIDNERRLECLREKLALKSDFNLLQFWGLFDTEGRGYATAWHVQNAFNAVGLNISLTQARLFAGKLNSDSEPRLRYADMAKAFLPTKARYAEAMINRTSNGSHKCPAPLTHLAPETLDIVAAIFDLTLASEEQAELSRHRLCLKDLSAAFHELDKNGDGYITAAEFSSSLMAHGFCPSEAELNALVSRYDKNGDSKVSYAEFVNEIGRTRCPVGCCRLICLCR